MTSFEQTCKYLLDSREPYAPCCAAATHGLFAFDRNTATSFLSWQQSDETAALNKSSIASKPR